MRQLAVSQADIQFTIRALADRINEDYKGKQVVFVGVLNGCFMFFSDLIKQIILDCEVDFIAYKSYEGNNPTIQGQLLKGLKLDVTDKIVIVVDEIIDTGRTKVDITKLILAKGAREVKWCFLLQRGFKEVKEEDYIGISINKDWFVYGYGLDNNEKNRNLTQIYY